MTLPTTSCTLNLLFYTFVRLIFNSYLVNDENPPRPTALLAHLFLRVKFAVFVLWPQIDANVPLRNVLSPPRYEASLTKFTI